MSSDTLEMMLVGIGGGGCRMVAAACRAHGAGLVAAGFDTDETTVRNTPGLKVHLMGATRLNKQGAGGVHANGRQAAQDDLPQILSQLKDARLVVVVACLGGGTGGGATPVILQALRAEGKLTLCFVTQPFAFEGSARRQVAERDSPLIEQQVDTLVQVPLDELYAGQEQIGLAEASREAEARLASGLCLLWRLLLSPGYIHLDPARLRNLLDHAGLARFGVAEGAGENRGEAAVAALSHAPLLRKGAALSGARALALGILAGSDLRLAEIGVIMNRIHACCPKEVHVEMGVVLDDAFAGRVELVVLAFEQWRPAEQRSGSAAAGGHGAGLLGKEHLRDEKLKGGSGKFRGVEKTVIKGENLDIPTYQRLQIRLER